MVATIDVFGEPTKRLVVRGDKSAQRMALGITGASGGRENSPAVTFAPNLITARNILRRFGEDIEQTAGFSAWIGKEESKAAWLRRESTKIVPQRGKERPMHDYQQTAVAYGLAAKRYMLCDDRGLGKTREALEVGIEANLSHPMLIVCPNYLRQGWQREIDKWVPNAKVAMFDGNRKQRGELSDLVVEGANGFTHVICNYEMMRASVSAGGYPSLWKNAVFDMLICDEAHRLKSPKSQWLEGIKHIAARVGYVQLLTGSPMSKDPSDLWQLLNILDPLGFSSKWHFIEYYCDTRETPWATEIVGAKKEHLEDLHDVLARCMVRRMKADVAPWLPPKIYKDIFVPLEGKQLSAYKKMEKQMLMELADGTLKKTATMIERHIRLQQLLANPLLLDGVDESAVENCFEELLKDVLESDDKVFVGTWFVKAAHLLARKVPKEATCYVVTGETPASERDAIIEQFRKGEGKAVLIGTIKSLGEGINLDECDHVIFCDQSWNPADNEQFEDRIHRITSTRTKTVTRIIAADTVSEAKHEVLRSKNATISETMAMEEALESIRKKRGE